MCVCVFFCAPSLLWFILALLSGQQQPLERFSAVSETYLAVAVLDLGTSTETLTS